jgi:hypothetical protein
LTVRPCFGAFGVAFVRAAGRAVCWRAAGRAPFFEDFADFARVAGARRALVARAGDLRPALFAVDRLAAGELDRLFDERRVAGRDVPRLAAARVGRFLAFLAIAD